MVLKEVQSCGAVLVAADIHGNIGQYDTLFSFARKNQCGGMIFCGDITPKHPANASNQRKFLQEYLFAKLEVFQRQFAEPLPVFIMMGNDDLRTNEGIIVENQERYHYTYIHNRIVPFKDHFVFGYSFVPPTPFEIKDWDKYEGTKENVDRGSFKKKGVFSIGDDFVTATLDPSTTITKDLEKSFLGFSHFDKLIFVSHAPPYGTNLDMLEDCGGHAGSLAIREFIAQKRPLVSLHGHIHETVDISGSWFDCVDQTGTLSITVGNRPDSSRPHIVLLDLSGTAPVAERRHLSRLSGFFGKAKKVVGRQP